MQKVCYQNKSWQIQRILYVLADTLKARFKHSESHFGKLKFFHPAHV